MHKRLVPVVLMLLATACGGAGVSDDTTDRVEPGESTSAEDEGSVGGIEVPVEDSCVLADADMVQEAFGGKVAEGVEGSGYACEFEISDGPVDTVRVREAGPSSSLEGVRSGYHDNFEGTFDVPGIGDEAFYPGIHGPLLLVVSASGQIFVVDAHSSFTEAPPGTDEMVADLARAIAARLEG